MKSVFLFLLIASLIVTVAYLSRPVPHYDSNSTYLGEHARETMLKHADQSGYIKRLGYVEDRDILQGVRRMQPTTSTLPADKSQDAH